MTREYIAAEPKQVSGFLSEDGQFHRDRNEALTENVRRDLAKAAIQMACANRGAENVMHWFGKEFVRIVENQPDMVRALLGDIDAT